ncbi:MAG: IscS subfamily cysteine desulfurase, partial [Desulfosalsimonas sp.]
KFEIASCVLEEYGYEPLPVFTPPAEGPRTRPDLAEHYPLIFNSGARLRTSFHTQHHGISSLNRHRPSPAVTINTADASARGIENGDRVRITTPRGSVCMRARVTDDIAPGSIDANHACGSPLGPEDWRSTNVNDLTDLDQYDPISGFPVYKSLLCEVEKAGAEERQEIGSEELSADEIAVGRQEQTAVPEILYLDHNATAPIHPAVMEVVGKAMETYGNPSSIHSQGIGAGKILDEARRNTAGALGCTARRVVFTGGGTEAANLAIKGVAACCADGRSHIVTSAIEHPAVLNTCRWLETRGYPVTYLGVDEAGRVRPEDLEAAISDRTLLVSVMTANNETGVIQPISELAGIAKNHGALFHTDAVQAFGKIPIVLDDIDLLSISAHKVHGPKGVGGLYIAKGVDMEALIHGGGQEFGLRSGTENLPGIAGLGKAAQLAPELVSEGDRLRGLRDRLEEGIGRMVPGCRVNGHRQHRLPNTLNVTLPGFRGESVVLEMARRGICFSSGSACHSGSSEPSHALLAMGLSVEDAHCALRFSLGRQNTEADVDRVLDQLDKTLTGSKNIVHFVPCR